MKRLVLSRSRRAVAVAALLVAPACGRNDRATNAAQAAIPHGDHNPRHGGVVLMHGDLHYEVLLNTAGHYQVYFSDARRAPLPATTVSKVTITIARKGNPVEVVALQIADDGESWVGDGKAVGEPDASARVAYEMDGKTYWIDVPFAQSLGRLKST